MIASVHCRDSVRAPGPDDAAALEAMFERCSIETRYGRFLSPIPRFPPGHLDDIVHPRAGRWSWVITDDDTDDDEPRIVALASLFGDGDTAELGLMVEDAEQRRGLGTDLLGCVAAQAVQSGVRALVAVTLVQSHHVRRMLERLGPVTTTCSGFTCDLRLEVQGSRDDHVARWDRTDPWAGPA